MAANAHGASQDAANPQPNPEWLALLDEAAIEPDLPIIDAHHHLWDRPHPKYLIEDLLHDINSGHRIEASVFVEAGSMWRRDGEPRFRTIGEVEFANGAAAMSESGIYGNAKLCSAIVGHADLSLGAAVDPVLEKIVAAGNGRLRGVRHSAASDPEVRLLAAPGLIRSSAFKEGFGVLQKYGLTFDLWVYHPQLGDALDLLQSFPEAKIAINHLGGVIGIGSYADQQADVTSHWRATMLKLAEFPNVHVKLSGLGMKLAGFELHNRTFPPSSDELARLWWPRIAGVIETFGPDRCMFASNFPVDKASCSYVILWNAFKSMTKALSLDERSELFYETAKRFYGMNNLKNGK